MSVAGEAGGGTVRHNLLYPELTVLDSSHNQLTSLPPEVSEMTGLTELKLGHNKLKEVSTPIIRSSIIRLLSCFV